MNLFIDYIVDDWVASDAKYILNSNDNVNIYIASIGGNVNKGFEIANLIQAHAAAGKTIHTHILSNADSIATVIFLAANKENRHIVESSTLFIHEPRFMMSFDIDQKAADKMSEELEIQKNRIADYYVKRIEGLSKSEALALMSGEKNLTSSDMLSYGIVGEVKEHLDIAAQRGLRSELIKNQNKMGLFGSNKKTLNIVNSGKNTFAYEGDLVEGSELTKVGDAEARLEGEHVIADGRTLVVSAANKVEKIKKKKEEEKEDPSNLSESIINSVSDMLSEFETKMTALIDSKIENVRKTGSTHTPDKGTVENKEEDQPLNMADIKKAMIDRINAKRK